MRLHNKFYHSVASGEWKGANFMSNPARELCLTQHFLCVWELLHQDLSLHILGTLHPTHCFVYLVRLHLIPHMNCLIM